MMMRDRQVEYYWRRTKGPKPIKAQTLVMLYDCYI